MGHLTRGYRLDYRGRMESRPFDIDDLLHGEAKRNGWYDSPSKVPGGVKAIEIDQSLKAMTADTIAPEPPMTGRVHGDKRGPGRPRKNAG